MIIGILGFMLHAFSNYHDDSITNNGRNYLGIPKVFS